MYAYEYANRNFSYAYKGNYNNIFLFNDKKPEGFEVEPTSFSSGGFYLPVELHEDNSDFVKLIIDNPVQSDFFEKLENDMEGLLQSILEIEEPKLLIASTADYLMDQGYMTKTDIEKSMLPDDTSSVITVKLYKLGKVYYVYSDSGNNLDEVVVTGSNPNSIKPFIDFDDAIDKEGNQLIVMVSDDGAKINNAYLTANQVNSNEIVLFIEETTESNLFGSAVRVRTGANVSQLNNNQKRIITKLLKKMDLEINENKIVKILAMHVNDSKEKGDMIYYVKRSFLGFSSIVAVPATLPLIGLGAVSGTLISAIEEHLMLGENRWKYYTKEGDKNPEFNSFLPIDVLIEGLEQLSDTSDGFVDASLEVIDEKLNAIDQEIHKIIIGGKKSETEQLSRFLKAVSKGLKAIKKAIKDALKNLIDFSLDALLFVNALVVGLINSLLETLVFILQIIKLLFNYDALKEQSENLISETKATLSMYLEVIENGIDIMNKLFSKKTLASIIKFKLDVYQLLYTVATNPALINVSLPKADTVGYYIGFIVGVIIEEIITALFTAGTLNVAKATQVAVKGMQETLQGLKAIPKSIGKTLENASKNTAIKLIKLMQGVKSMLTDLPKHLDDLLHWLIDLITSLGDEINKIFQGFKAVLDLLLDLGVVIVKKLDPSTGNVIVQGADGTVFAIKQGDKTILEGTKTAIEDFLSKIDDISKSGGSSKKKVQEYLDEVVEGTIFSRLIGNSPLFGFKGFGQLKQFGAQIFNFFNKKGYKNVEVYMQGSSVTGKSYETGKVFDVGRVSDFDIGIVSEELLDLAFKNGLAKNNRPYSLPLEIEEMTALGFKDLVISLQKQYNRKINFRFYKTTKDIFNTNSKYKINY